MDNGDTTIILGIPVPSRDPVFLAIVAVHVLLGIGAAITGAIAMLSKKGRGRHSKLGKAYFWSLVGVSITMGALAIMSWAHDYPLFILGVLSFVSAYIGRRAAGRYEVRWLRLHIGGMSASYIFMLTAFYVDNGGNLPLWRELPPLAFWLLPTAVGLPLILRAVTRHPLIIASGD